MKFDIEKLALLARIKLDSQEKEKLQEEFRVILNYISKLKEADVSKINKEDAGRTTDLENIMRGDENSHRAEKFPEDLLSQAPSVEKGYVKVKHIME